MPLGLLISLTTNLLAEEAIGYKPDICDALETGRKKRTLMDIFSFNVRSILVANRTSTPK